MKRRTISVSQPDLHFGSEATARWVSQCPSRPSRISCFPERTESGKRQEPQVLSILIVGLAAAEFVDLCDVIHRSLPTQQFRIQNLASLSGQDGRGARYDLAILGPTVVERPWYSQESWASVPATILAMLVTGRESESIAPVAGGRRVLLKIRASATRIALLLRHTPRLLDMVKSGRLVAVNKKCPDHLTRSRKVS